MKSPTLKASDFPPPGTILSFALEDGRFGACQILRVDIPEHCDRFQALAMLTEYIGSTAPQIGDPALRRPLLLNHHSWSNRPYILWVDELPPGSYAMVGFIAVTEEQARIDPGAHGAWASLPLQRLRQWRWEHDRDALLAEEAIATEKEKHRLAAEAERRARILARTTLPIILKRKHLLPRWKGQIPAKTIRAFEQPIREFLASLIEMKAKTRRDITRELRGCVRRLNETETASSHPIESTDRDDLFELFEEILLVAGQPSLIDKLDEWREW